MTSFRFARLMAGVCAAAAAAFAGASARADEASNGHWAFATGLNYTTGNYGESQDTNVYAVPFSAGYEADRWSFSVSVPYVRLQGSGNIIPGAVSAFGPGAFGGGANTGGANAGTGTLGAGLGSGGLGLSPGSGLINVIVSPPAASPPGPPAPPAPPVRIEEEGLGDTTLSLSVTPFVSSGGGRFTLATDFRLPTGDDQKSLGAGETIGSVSAGYALPVGGSSAIYAAVGYQKAFDSDISGASAGVGAQTQWSGVLLGAGVDWAETSVNGLPNQSQATVYAGFDLAPHTRLAAFALAGLTRTSPDAGFGLRLVFQP